MTSALSRLKIKITRLNVTLKVFSDSNGHLKFFHFKIMSEILTTWRKLKDQIDLLM